MKTLINLFLIAGISLGLAVGCKKRPQARHDQSTATTNEQAGYPAEAFESTRKPAPEAQKTPPEILPGSLRYLDVKNGFRDVTFGQSENSIPNLILKNSDDAHQLKTYTRSDENLKLNDVPLKKIEYTFFKGQLYQVTVKWVIEEKSAVLKNVTTNSLAPFCAKLYGPARKHMTKKDGSEYVWRGRHVELFLNETRLPGVENTVRGDWATPPTLMGTMLVESIDLRKAISMEAASVAEQKKDGL